MKTDLTIESPHRRGDGQIGAHATVKIADDSGWHQSYSFDTHGMTSQQVADKTAAMEAHHARKVERLNGFRSVQGRQIVKGGATYRIADCTILENGITLYVDVRPKVSGFPIRKPYGILASIPSDEEIVAMITAALPGSTDEIQQAHDAFVEKVNTKRGK